MAEIPVIAFAGYSGSGKTTLIEKLLGIFSRRGISTAVIKHDAHGLKFDTEGKDSDRFMQAGAGCSLVNGPGQTAVFISRPLSLEESVALIRDVDLIIIEGYKNCGYPQIGICRRDNGKGFTAELSRFRAIACDEAPENSPVPVFSLNDSEGIADLIIRDIIRP